MKPLQLNRMTLIALIVGLAALAVACGSSGDEPASSTATSVPTATATSAQSEPTAVVDDEVEIGRNLFTSEGCSACHRTTEARLVGPGMAGISSRGDDAYIRKSIIDAGAEIVEGYANVMGDFSSLSDQKVDALIAYLKTLN